MTRLIPFFSKKRIGLLLLGVLFCGMLSGCQGGLEISDLAKLMKPTLAMCWPCTMYKVVFDALGSILGTVYTTMSHVALILLGIGMLFWIAFKVLGMVSTVKLPNLKEFLTSSLSTMFKALVVAAVLSSPSYAMAVLDMIASPILTMFIEMSRTVLLSDPTIAKHFSSPVEISFGVNDNLLFNGKIGEMVQDIVYRIFMALHSGLVLGFRLFIGVDVVAYIMGTAIVFVFGYLMIVFPLLFIDSFVRLGVIFVLFPILLASWVFPSTKQYISEAWKQLFGAMMQILIACVYIALMISVTKSYSDMHSLSRQFSDPLMLLGLKSAATESLGFFALIFTMMKLTDRVPAMAGYFGGDAKQSELTHAINNTWKTSRAMGKMAVGGIMVGTGIGVQAGKNMFKDSYEEMQESVLGSGTVGYQNSEAATQRANQDDMAYWSSNNAANRERAGGK